jgi:hypothetical protein
MKPRFFPTLHHFRKSIAFCKVARLHPFVLVEQSVDEDEYEAMVE